jgi:hypothetical protein
VSGGFLIPAEKDFLHSRIWKGERQIEFVLPPTIMASLIAVRDSTLKIIGFNAENHRTKQCLEGIIHLVSVSTTKTIITMALTAPQAIVFWTAQAQMGLPDRTRIKFAAEGLTNPEDFIDFPEKEDLDALILKCLKPAKIAGGNAVLIPPPLLSETTDQQ